MQRSQDQRINLRELKEHIVKKIGVEKSKRYFYYLSRFLNQKLTKSEFDKTCFRLLGRENLSLHNQLIRSILRNVTVAKSPPTVQEASHLTKPLANALQSREDGPEQSRSLNPVHNLTKPLANALQSREDGPEQSRSLNPVHNQTDPVCSDGVMPISPREVRSGARDKRSRDKPSPLGSDRKAEHMLQQPNCREDNRGSVGKENENLDCQRSKVSAADERDGEFHHPVKNPRIQKEDQPATTAIRVDEKQEEQARLNLSTSPPVAPASVSETHKMVPISTSTNSFNCYNPAGLPDTEMLKKKMENIAAAQGLGGVSMDCANTLNKILDVYVKKLIKSGVDLAGPRSTNANPGKLSSDKQQRQNKIVNGVCPSNNVQLQTPMEPSNHYSISLLDFRVAMELKQHQLGENWPIIRERISMRSFEEQEL